MIPMKRKLACFGLGFALAELVAAYLPPLVLVPAAALFALLVFFHRGRISAIPFLGVLSGFLFFALYTLVVVKPVQRYAGQTASCTVVVETDAESSYQEGMMRGTLQVLEVDGEKTDFRVQCAAFPAAEPGEKCTARLTFRPLEEDRYAMSYRSKGVYLQAVYQGEAAPAGQSRAIRFPLYRLRQTLSRALQRWMPKTEGELEAAMLLGEKEGLPDAVNDAFRAAGVSHLLAVSGLHVALLCGIFSLGYRRRFLRPWILLRLGLVLFYMVLTGMSVSVMRAGLVFVLALAGDFFWQPTDPLTSTGAAAVLISLQNAYAPCDVGFQLSFCAVVGVQLAVSLAAWERKKLSSLKPTAIVRILCFCRGPLEAIQVAALAGVATMPVLIAHGMSMSGVGVLTNLLTVWMLEPALRLGILVLVLAAVPGLDPVMHMASLVLTLWLRLLLRIVTWCAALPLARLDLPGRYTLLAVAVLGILAIAYWYAGKMVWYLPAAVFCATVCLLAGYWAQKDVVRITLVGAVNNPCAVCTQNGAALILFRGGQSNLNAVTDYLAEHASPDVTLLVDLRQQPSPLEFDAALTVQAEQLPAYTRQNLLDDVVLDLYHNTSGNLAVLGIGERHIALSAGKVTLPAPVSVDVFCAAGTLPPAVQAQTIVFGSQSSAWLTDAQAHTLLYGPDEPAIVVRPGHSMTFEEVKRVALQ